MSDLLLRKVFGAIKHGNTTRLSFNTVAVSATLEPYCAYRVIATQDCHIALNTAAGDTVDSSDAVIAAGQPEVINTTGQEYTISALQYTVSGLLFVTKLI